MHAFNDVISGPAGNRERLIQTSRDTSDSPARAVVRTPQEFVQWIGEYLMRDTPGDTKPARGIASAQLFNDSVAVLELEVGGPLSRRYYENQAYNVRYHRRSVAAARRRAK